MSLSLKTVLKFQFSAMQHTILLDTSSGPCMQIGLDALASARCLYIRQSHC